MTSYVSEMFDGRLLMKLIEAHPEPSTTILGLDAVGVALMVV